MDRVRTDFFVSYTSADEAWAEWIAHALEDAGYTVVIQAWDFRPGSNFVVQMQKALQESDRMIAVLSPDYLTARFPQAEWAATFAGDPEGTKRRLIPVMVRPCEPDGLLSQVVQIRIHGLNDTAAKQKLLDGVRTGRAKPSEPPPFPGTTANGSDTDGLTTQSSVRLAWHRLSSPVDVVWRSELEGSQTSPKGYEAVELHLVAVGDEARLQVRDLADLSAILPGYGRQKRVFSAVQALDVRSDATRAVVVSTARDDVAGLGVTRSGQRSTWAGLPRDMLGAVLDESYLAEELARMLDALAVLPVPEPALAVPVVGIEPATMVALGRISELPRSSAQIGLGMRKHVRPIAEEAVAFAAVRARGEDIAIELAARLVAEHRKEARLG